MVTPCCSLVIVVRVNSSVSGQYLGAMELGSVSESGLVMKPAEGSALVKLELEMEIPAKFCPNCGKALHEVTACGSAAEHLVQQEQ